MSLPQSVLLAMPAIPATTEEVEVLRPYGEHDDPLRLVVVLANHVRRLLPCHDDLISTCLDRRSAWRARITALRTLLSATQALGKRYAALLDPDALAPTTRPGWEDRTSHRMREDIRRVILGAIDQGGWLVAQPHPTTVVSDELDQINIDRQEGPAAIEPALAVFAPDVRPVARWLANTGRLPLERLPQVVEDTKDPGQHILRIAYDALPEGAREAGRRLQVTRAPSERNGHMGRFRWTTTPNEPMELAKQDVDALEQAGMLVADDERHPRTLRMPRRVRELFKLHARALESETVQALHLELATDAQFQQRAPEEKMEVHYHAARAGDLKRARETAVYFGLELRDMATQLSRVHQKYEEAANLFRELVQEFDPTDAYAWEYLGYNLARSYKVKPGQPHPDAPEILAAYEKAHTLDKRNPLYHGRYLGYRAELGYPILDEANASLAMFAAQVDADDLVSWFVRPLVQGLNRGARYDERDKLLQSWSTLLQWSASSVFEKPSVADE